jgi:hypothetical protein
MRDRVAHLRAGLQERSDPGSCFERPAGLVCSRRNPASSSDHTEHETFEGFGRSPDRFGAYADS